MDTNINYKVEYRRYWMVLIGLLILTAVTLTLPMMLAAQYTVSAQMFVAVLKGWLIVLYYMHLKGERLIGSLIIISLAIVAVFFIIVGIDVANFQFSDVSHITSQAH